MVIANMSEIVQSLVTSPLNIAAIGVIGAVLGAFAGGYATYSIEKLKIKNNEFEKRRQIYVKLGGLETKIAQIFMMFHEVKVYCKFYSNKWKNLGEPANSIELKRSEEYYKLSVDMAIKFHEADIELSETFNSIRLLFNDTNELEKLIENFNSINSTFNDRVDIEDKVKNMDNSQLDEWCKNEVNNISDTSSRVVWPLFRELEKYLKNEIDAETKSLYGKPFWKFWKRE